ncbi:MAG: outer membrane protein assembly factor BamA [Candidatus Aminicenantes bacterium]|nr:outer membrane protein assembly factor BamA [Candidatus Aminicenantes bacterium]NIM80493.1 outer membrane protein assembly factor BamA [Candidatus Aminicenantes bacterium]NIN23935.1 outer membrane protein assembly factor BamA [Candidatus Aminicenantes bacterium]NIN47649.1 outer membrane protein assembly factor BamA [Candidatus Aminicenantes bacterium]NIN90579.1 outer membrane protein assembly factor BamA [Candidatus Aminicenantes bacterium]
MRKKVLWILGSLLLLLVILVGLVHTPFVKVKVLKHLQKTLAQSLNLSLSAQSLDYNLFTLRVSLKKPTAGTHDNSTLPPFFQADELNLRLTPALILGKKIDIRDIRVVNPRVDIRVNQDGTFNIPPQLFQESGEPTPPLFIRNISIEGGVLSYRDPAGDLQADIPGIHLAGTLMDEGKQELILQVEKNKTGPGQLIYQDKRLRLESVNISARLDSQDAHITLNATELQGNEPIRINGQIHWKDNRLSIPELHIIAAGGEISGNGDFYQKEGKSEPGKQTRTRLSLTWESLNLQSPLLTAYFSHPLYSKTSGRLDLVAVDFSLDGLQGNAAVTLVPLKIPAPKADQVFLAGGITARLEYGTIIIRDFNFATPGKRVHGNFLMKNRQVQGELYGSFQGEQVIDGHVRLSGQTNPLNIIINAKEIRLEQLMNYFQKDFPVKGTLSMAAHVLPHRIEADILLANGSYRMQDQAEVVPGEISGRFQLVNNRLNYQLRVPELSIEITGTGRMVPPYPLLGTAYIDIPDFGKLSQRQGFDVLEGISGNMTGQVNFGLDLDNALKTAKVEADIKKFFMRTWQKELENQEPIRISFNPEGITVESLKLKGPGSHVQVNGFLPLIKRFCGGVQGGQFFQKAPPLAAGGTEGLTFSAQIDPVLLNPFAAPYRFSGSISLQTRISGSLAEPVLSSELILKEFSIEGEPPQPGMGTEKGLNGRLEGRIKISGNVRDLRELSADADFSSMRLNIPGFPAISSAKPVKFRLEKGRFLVDQFSLTDESNWGQLDVSGAANLMDQQVLDFRVIGQVDAKLVGSFLEEMQLAGKNSLDFRVSGHIQKPEISGSLDLENIEMRYINPNLYINQLNGKLRLSRDRVLLEALKGNLNGGPMTIHGEISYDNSGIREMDLKLTAKDSHFEYPPGLFSEVSGEVTLTFNGKDYLLKGIIDIGEGVYKEPFNVMSELFTYIRGTPTVPVPEEADSFWERLNLDIGLRTSSPLLINNNISRSELSADLSLRGSYNYPALSGRLTITEGGEIYLGSSRYSIESGIINFVNPYRLEPDLRIRARTKVQDYDIVLELSGTPETIKASFTSTPSLSEPNIISLLVTGKTLESVSGSLLDTTGSQALSYIGSTLSGKIQQFTKQKLGIDQVRIDGSLIASKNNPGARLTVGQRLTSNLELTLSQDLKQAQNRSWILDYTPFTNVTIQGIKQDNEQYSAALMHDIRFRLGSAGSGDRPKATKKSPPKPVKVGDIQFNGDIGIPGSTLHSTLKLRKGRTFNYFKFQADLERLGNLYLKNNYLWADIKPKRQEENGKITIIYTIGAGPQIFLEFQGAALPRRFRKKLVKLWSEGQFVQQSTKNVIGALSLYLFKKGYCQAKVSTGPPETAANNVHRYPFTIEKGLKYRRIRFLFQGNRLISGKRLHGFLKVSRLKWLVFQQPGRVARELSQYCRERGFLTAQCREPEIQFLPLEKKVIVTVPVEEGPLFKIEQISFTGNRLLDGETLVKAISVKKDQVFSPVKFIEAKYEIAAAYARKGFNDVRVTSQKRITKEKGVVDLVFGIEENLRGVIREITITGNSLTRTSVIRRELSFKKGDILDFQEINKSRKKLYDLGIFQWVNIETVPLNASQEKETNKDFRVEIQLNEIKPYRLKTGLRWDTEKSLGVLAELDNPNIAGRAHYLGASFSIDNKKTNVKTYYRFPYFLGKKIATEFFVFASKEKEPSFTVNRRGLTLQQQFRPGKTLVFSWNYTWERTHTFGPPPQKLFIDDTVLNLAHVTAAFSYDRRNSLVNPTRGFFFSASFQHAARFLGSDANFSRFFCESHWYVPLRRFLVSATSIRIGSGRGLGQENLPGERFFAGGGSTIRGFRQSMVGPLDPEGNPLGGEALFIFKQELRVRLHDLFSFVLFADLGNVYNTAAEFNMFNVRKSAGFGFRIHTDLLLLRFDWGFKLDRQPGESPSRIFLSIGQAF